MISNVQCTSNSIVCTVPVNTTDIYDFCDTVGYPDLAQKISDFLTQKFAEFGVNKEILKYDIAEIIKNSCDSFISTGNIVPGSSLVFSASVKKEEDTVFVKFKDNGKGLGGQGKFFDIADVKSTKMPFYMRANRVYAKFGGNGLALSQTNESIKRQGGTVQLKNRKVAGCAVYVKFKV